MHAVPFNLTKTYMTPKRLSTLSSKVIFYNMPCLNSAQKPAMIFSLYKFKFALLQQYAQHSSPIVYNILEFVSYSLKQYQFSLLWLNALMYHTGYPQINT
jgi:hypothetical protein